MRALLPSTSRMHSGAITLLAVGFVALLTLVVTGFYLNARAERSFNLVLVARNLSAVADGLKSALQLAEASERGYLITDNEIYLAPYLTARGAALQRLDDLKTALPEDASTAGALTHLEKLIAEKMSLMEVVIALKRAGQDDGARSLVQTNRGKALLDEANVFLSSFVRLGDARLKEAADDQRRWLSITQGVNLAAAVVIAAVAVAVVWNFVRFSRTLVTANAEIQALNIGLEERVRSRTAELSAARDRAELLMSEISHRVANSLALVTSMIRLQARSLEDDSARALLQEVHDRIYAVGLVHRKLYGSSDIKSTNLGDLVSSLVDQLADVMHESGHRNVIRQDIAPISLGTDKSVAVGVIVSELITNAFKYAYAGKQGEIRVSLKQSGDSEAVLTVADDGLGRTDGAAPKGSGLGSRLISSLVNSLDGTIEYASGNPGTIAKMTFPV